MNLSSFDALYIQWQDNYRLRIGVALILILMLANIVLAVNDYKNVVVAEVHNKQLRLSKTRNISEQVYWHNREKQAKEVLVQLNNRFWMAESKSVAHATLQSWLTKKLSGLQLDDVSFEVLSVKEISGIDAWAVDATIKGAISFPKLLELLNVIETNHEIVKIELIDVNKSKNAYRLSMSLTTYFSASEK